MFTSAFICEITKNKIDQNCPLIYVKPFTTSKHEIKLFPSHLLNFKAPFTLIRLTVNLFCYLLSSKKGGWNPKSNQWVKLIKLYFVSKIQRYHKAPFTRPIIVTTVWFFYNTKEAGTECKTAQVLRNFKSISLNSLNPSWESFFGTGPIEQFQTNYIIIPGPSHWVILLIWSSFSIHYFAIIVTSRVQIMKSQEWVIPKD